MKATTLLERQQRELQELCETMETGSAGLRASLLPQLATDLVAHMAIEDQVFYPAVSRALHDDALVGSCRSGNVRARCSLRRALEVPVDADEFASAMGELRSAVQRHAEDDRGLFTRLEGVLEPRAIHDLGLSLLAAYHAQLEPGDVGPS
jgi:hypothetical protein